jgi:hypothetical protein
MRRFEVESNYDEALKCCWHCWRVVGPRRLVLEVKEFNSTDMGGAIMVGKRLMPDVQEIIVYSGDVPDIRYHRSDPGARWSSTNLRHLGHSETTERDDEGRPNDGVA